jgi:hypothetical protein
MSPVDNTPSASVTPREMAKAGYQQGKPKLNNPLPTKRPPEGGLRVVGNETRGSVANHYATPLRGAFPMPSPAAAWPDGRRHHDGPGNNDDGLAVRPASAIGTAVKTHTAATRHLNDQIGRSLLGGKRHGLHGTARKSQNKSKSDKLVHAPLLGFLRDAIMG